MINSHERAPTTTTMGDNLTINSGGQATANVLPKCCCSWKNCRAYQKAFREGRHEFFDGVVKIKLQRDHPESMALKESVDRTLGVPESKANDWKSAKKGGQPEVIKYIIARHHFTAKHMQKYLQDPKNFSFLKPFSIHGAKKYLHTVDRQETLPTSGKDELFLQCPNVPKEAVKQEFQKVMEKIRSKKKKINDEKSVASTLQVKEAENRILKEQLDAMKSQLTFLHDMVQKLQEQHFDAQSVRSRSRHTQRRSIPKEIELGEEEEEETYWNENTEGDWTDNYNSESNRDEDDEQTTSTFQVTYSRAASRRGSVGSVHSKAASTIVSASKSVKTLPREIELDEDEDDSESHESLEEEAFDNRSFASSYAARSRRSFVSSNDRSRGQSAMNAGSRKAIGPNCKMPSRRVSNEERRASQGSGSEEKSDMGGTYEVTSMIVTDPYGEKGLYTGSISSSTGMPHGFGRLEYDKAGRWYEGDWKHGRWTGHGQLSNGDGDFYEGGLKNDHKHGKGKMQFADGRTFEGEYMNGQMVHGKMTYQDGSTFEGSWVDGMRHGRGRCVFTDNSIYEGEFREGEFYGHGKMTWNDGGWYEGEWLNGDMHGRGKEVRADGSLRHDGEWLKGQPIRNKK